MKIPNFAKKQRDRMRKQTLGIVLRYFRYGDNGMIAHIYTRDYGRQSFIFKSSKSRKSKNKLHFLQPLALVEIPIDYKPQKEMYMGNGATSSKLFQDIPFNQVKNSIAFFIAELLSKVLQYAQEADESLFSFLKDAIVFLDDENIKGTNFHLAFLVKLTAYLGIQPEEHDAEHSYLNISQGEFSPFSEIDSLTSGHSTLWKTLQNKTWVACDAIPLSREKRNAFLEKVLQYYTYHFQDLGKFKSLEVLHEVFG
ncbi:DNA replication and repair protein RecO [Balneicella halophila]|uniref:DNA repair protein RecO n=1 Tax=Balneicella halophila TaxID=1537566 RepID=A0A7L4UQB6_BALHA|nr:DNA repair protein RecO [Balneicella halophila]PVX51978.1 DNA replication and repair protein RecO [Balneicella halophila]